MKDVTFKLVEMIFQISRQMKDELSFDSEIMRLSILQFHVLMFLCQAKEATMSSIAEHFRIELPSASSLISTLAERNLVNRSASVADKRLVMISLTDEGNILLKQAKTLRKTKLEKNLALFSDAEKIELFNLLQKLQQRLQK